MAGEPRSDAQDTIERTLDASGVSASATKGRQSAVAAEALRPGTGCSTENEIEDGGPERRHQDETCADAPEQAVVLASVIVRHRGRGLGLDGERACRAVRCAQQGKQGRSYVLWPAWPATISGVRLRRPRRELCVGVAWIAQWSLLRGRTASRRCERTSRPWSNVAELSKRRVNAHCGQNSYPESARAPSMPVGLLHAGRASGRPRRRRDALAKRYLSRRSRPSWKSPGYRWRIRLGRERGEARDARGRERALGEPRPEPVEVKRPGRGHALQSHLGQPAVARPAQAAGAHALRERALDAAALGVEAPTCRAALACPGRRERLVLRARVQPEPAAGRLRAT